ncbi:hypothetical protein BDF21DRAFT_162517 [Thamnidium elegans]|nr:hypothetical protein BDF21DRAFT_162517 [Thamnidium elegans]
MCISLIGKMINHDDAIPEDDLASYVKITDMAWEARNKRLKEARKPPPLPLHGPTSIEEENKANKETKKIGFRNKIKSFIGKTDGSEAKPRNRPIPKSRVSDEPFMSGPRYIKGSYECPPQYTLNEETSVVEINNDSNYEPEKASFHDKRAIREFIDLNNSDETMDATFSNVKNSVYGFIGTSTCGNTEILNQWTTETDESNNAQIVTNSVSPNHSSYTKVFKTSKV